MDKKYKAFNMLDNKLYEVDALYLHKGKVDMVTISKGKDVDTVSADDVQLIEATGIKDKNGVEIWELDMITMPTGETALVAFHEGMYKWLFKDGTIIMPISWDQVTTIGCVLEPVFCDKKSSISRSKSIKNFR